MGRSACRPFKRAHRARRQDLDSTFMESDKHNILERFLRLDSTFTDAEKHTMLERVLWAMPPVLIAWMLTFGSFMLVLAILSGHF